MEDKGKTNRGKRRKTKGQKATPMEEVRWLAARSILVGPPKIEEER